MLDADEAKELKDKRKTFITNLNEQAAVKPLPD